MRNVVVLSPHRDDAVFSLACWMRQWAGGVAGICIFNFYTVSEYAPWITGADRGCAAVAARRGMEDRAAIRLISPLIKSRSFGLLDAPLRLGLPVGKVMQLGTADIRRFDVGTIYELLSRIEPATFVVAPLGLGGHIDHLTVRQAALECLPPDRLGFYEDLPYATWTPEDTLRQHIRQVSRLPLRRFVQKPREYRLLKQTWVARYRSQIRRDEAQLMARHSEIIWAPSRLLTDFP